MKSFKQFVLMAGVLAVLSAAGCSAAPAVQSNQTSAVMNASIKKQPHRQREAAFLPS